MTDSENKLTRHPGRRGWRKLAGRNACLAAAVFAVLSGAISVYTTGAEPARSGGTLDETRVALSKWIETQQIISKERKEWQQGKEILVARTEMVEKEIKDLEDQIKKAQDVVAEAHKKRDELQKQNDDLKTVGAQMKEAVIGMEGDVRNLFKQLPTPVQEKLQGPLYSRIPQDPDTTKVAIAERYQNVLGIFNEVNKANSEISVNYEVRDAAEVKVIYIGLAQAYYVSATGAAGVSHPTADGWKSEPLKSISGDLLKTLEIIQGKQTATFVPLPMKIQ